MLLNAIFDWLLTWSRVISGLGSLGLSTVLAYLYFKMSSTQQERTEIHDEQTSIQEKQTDIMEAQTELTKVGNSADVQVDAFGVYNENNFSNFRFLVSNIGKGYAANLRLRIQPFTGNIDGIESKQTEHILRDSEQRDEMRVTRDNYILPGVSEKEYICSSSLYVSSYHSDFDSPTTHEAVFEFAMEMMDEEGEDDFRFKLYIVYDDAMGDETVHEFADLVVPIRGRTSFEVAMEHAVPYEQYTRETHHPGLSRWDEIEEDTGSRGLVKD